MTDKRLSTKDKIKYAYDYVAWKKAELQKDIRDAGRGTIDTRIKSKLGQAQNLLDSVNTSLDFKNGKSIRLEKIQNEIKALEEQLKEVKQYASFYIQKDYLGSETEFKFKADSKWHSTNRLDGLGNHIERGSLHIVYLYLIISANYMTIGNRLRVKLLANDRLVKPMFGEYFFYSYCNAFLISHAVSGLKKAVLKVMLDFKTIKEYDFEVQYNIWHDSYIKILTLKP